MQIADMMTSGNLLSKTKKIIVVIIILIFAAIIGLNLLLKKQAVEKQNYPEAHSKVIQLGKMAWGYEIYLNNKLFIRQTQIPCLEGERPFNSFKDAYLIGELIVSKINSRQSARITKQELAESGIRF
jgi:hypothetical protein